eukprot:5425742-Pleurochrysis_carterae.AAC.1
MPQLPDCSPRFHSDMSFLKQSSELIDYAFQYAPNQSRFVPFTLFQFEAQNSRFSVCNSQAGHDLTKQTSKPRP